ncbi:MAG: hypothetical protein IK038_02320 [Bacteroidaceae bacterium]|nr:hypothetical protein [Bacteroidaceae bacterium]
MFPIGDVSVDVRQDEDDGKVWITMSIPLRDRGGVSYWHDDLLVESPTKLDVKLVYLFRRIVGVALLNTIRRDLESDLYAMQNFAEWEKSIKSDSDKIADLSAYISQLYSDWRMKNDED